MLSTQCTLLLYWERRAHDLLPRTDAILQAVPDTWLRTLLRGARDHEPLQLGQRTHVALWEELMQHAKSVDTQLVKEMTTGMSIVEDIRRAHRWEPYDKPQELMPFSQLKDRAWEFRQKVLRNVLKCAVTDNTQKVWDATIEDVKEGLTQGPFYDQKEVSRLVGDPWIPTQRFEVVQKNKVRGVEDQQGHQDRRKAGSPLNGCECRSSSLAQNASRCWCCQRVGARREKGIQTSANPPITQTLERDLHEGSLRWETCFLHHGRSFVRTSICCIQLYNRRSAATTDILRRVFLVAAFNFYDDKYGFEPSSTIDSAYTAAQAVHVWLGARFDQKKLQCSDQPTILGVTYDLVNMQLLIKQDRKTELADEIVSILESQRLTPGQACEHCLKDNIPWHP